MNVLCGDGEEGNIKVKFYVLLLSVETGWFDVGGQAKRGRR